MTKGTLGMAGKGQEAKCGRDFSFYKVIVLNRKQPHFLDLDTTMFLRTEQPRMFKKSMTTKH